MADDLILKTNRRPSYWNQEMSIGSGLALLAVAVAPAALLNPLGFALLIGAGGAGALIGKNRMEHEAREGKRVSESYNPFNKDMVWEGLLGASLAGLVSMMFFPFADAAYIASTVVGGIVGAVAGSAFGKQKHDAEYEAAKRQTIVQHLSQNVSPEVGQAVEYAMSQDKNWAKDITERRMLEQAQSQQVH
jgi:hypothetical protein